MIKGTDIAIENLLLGRSETNLYEAPRLDLKDVKRTFVSITFKKVAVREVQLTWRVSTKKAGKSFKYSQESASIW